MNVNYCAPALRATVSRLFNDWEFVSDASTVQQFDDGIATEIWSDHQGLVLTSIDSPPTKNYRLQFCTELAVNVLPDQKKIFECILDRRLSESAREHYLVDQVLPRILAHQGELVIHAGASRVDGRAIVLLGESGQGKSTLAASFDGAGYGLIGDDALVVSVGGGQPCVKTVYPSLRLFPDSIVAILSGAPAMSAVMPNSSKQRITVSPNAESVTDSIPIAGMFVLAPATSPKVEMRKLRPSELCMAMVQNSFSLDPTDLKRAHSRLASCSMVAREVPGYLISYPRDYAMLPKLRKKILAQINSDARRTGTQNDRYPATQS